MEIGNVPYRVEADQVLAKVDTEFSPAHRLTIRFNWAAVLDENAEPWGGQVARSRGAYLDARDVMGAALLKSFLSPHSFNELHLQLANRDQAAISLDPGCAGVCDRDDEGGPAVDIGPVKVGRQSMTPQPRDFRLYQLVDTLDYDMGRHYLKTGFDVSRVDLRSLALPMHFGGSYTFQQLQQLGLSDVEAFALGLPVAYTQGYGNPSASGVFSDLSLFAEDEWRVRPWRVKGDLTTRIGRNAGVLPGMSAVDVRVSRRVALGSRVELDLMVDMFNLLNHTNYIQVNAVFGTDAYPDRPRADFGQFTKAGPPFQMQLGAKISF